MKEVIGLLLCLMISLGTVQAQSNPPIAVVEAFNKLEPEVKNPFWEFREGAIVAMFSHEEGLKKVFFNQEGEWLETRTRLMAPALPKGVKAFVQKLYATTLITYIGKVEQPSQVLYRVETESDDVVSIRLLNESGQLLEEDRIELSLVPR